MSFNIVAENGEISSTGTLQIRVGDFIPTINADPVLTAADISRLAFKDIVGFDQDGAGAAVVGTINKQGSTLSTLTYDVTPAGSFAGAISTFDDFSTVAKEFLDLSAAGSLTVGLKLGAGQTGDIKLEIEDSTGAKAFVILSSITDIEKFYRVQLTDFLGVDLTKVVGFNLVLENGEITNAGALQIRLGDFITNVNPNPALTAANISHLTGLYNPIAVNGTATQLSATEYNVDFNVTAAGSFAAGISPFDDFGTVAKEVKDLSGVADIFVGLKLAAGTGTIVFEVEDSLGGKSIVKLNGVSTTEQFYGIALASLVGNVDLTKVTNINFTVISENVTTKVGTLSVRLGDHAFDSSIGPDTAVTSASQINTFNNLVGFQSAAPQPTATVATTIVNAGEFNINYDLSNAGSYGGSISTFDNFGTIPFETMNLSGLTHIDIGLQLSGGTGSVKVELQNGVTDSVVLSGIDTTQRYWRIPLSAFDNPALDLTAIRGINIVLEEGQLSASIGTLNVELGKHPYTSAVVSNPLLTAANISTFSGFYAPIGINSLVTLHSATQYDIAFNVTSANSFAAGLSPFDDFGTIGQEVKNLSGATIVVGLKLASGSGSVFVEVEDSNGDKSVVEVSGVDTTEKFFELPLTLFSDVNAAQITNINFVVKNGKVTDPTSALSVRMGNHPFANQISPNAVLTAADVSALSGLFEPIGINSLVTLNSAQRYDIAFNVTALNSFAAGVSPFDNFGTTGQEVKNLTGQTVVAGLRLDSGSGTVYVEVEDDSGNKASLELTGVDGTERFFEIPMASFSGVDSSRITNINFVLKNGSVSDPTAVLELRLGNHPFIESIAPNVAVTAPSLIDYFVELAAFDSDFPLPDATSSLNKLSVSEFELGFNTANPGSFAGSISSFDNYSTVPVEVMDLSGVTYVDIGLKLSAGSGNVMLELQSGTTTDYVILTGVDTTQRFWRIPLAAFNNAALDLTQIKGLNVIVQSGATTSSSGTLNVKLGNHQAFPTAMAAAYNQALLTQLSSSPSLSAGGGNTVAGQPDGVALASVLSDSEFEYEYNLQGNATAFAFARIANSDNSAFVLPQQFILAARGSLNALTRVEIKDENGVIASFALPLGVAYQNYTLDLSLAPAAFDRTKVKEIVFVQDANFKSGLAEDLVQVQIGGIDYAPTVLSAAQTQLKSDLISQGLDYFVSGVGIDPVTHLPYDRAGVKVTQPTLIGFYLQILAESIQGNLSNGMTTAQALTEINFVMDQLSNIQTNFGWKGLIPWMNVDPYSAASANYNFIDNGNLTLSLAVLAGALESAGLAGADAIAAAQAIAKVDAFIQAQKVGYVDLATQSFGLFAQGYNSATNSYDAWVNRVAVEFRPAIALLKTLYGSDIPDTAWSKILPNSGHEYFYNPTYVDRNGTGIANMGSWDGGAFQLFWPQLFVRESDFIGTRNALYNGLLSYLDYSNQNKIPGIISASDVPGEGYVGAQGVGILAESPIHQASGLLMDTGSIYALTSAYSVDPALVMGWLEAIGEQLNIEGIYGFFDAARSNREIVQTFIGIDVASTILGLAGTGPDAFKVFLRNRGLETGFNTLYDDLSRAMAPLIPKTDAVPAQAPEFADKSLSIFSDFVFEGVLNNFQTGVNTLFSSADYFQGYKFNYGDLSGVGGWGGHYWILSQDYDASAHELVIYAGVVNTPQQIRIELKNQADVTVYTASVNLPAGAFQTIRIQLPNEAALQGVRSVFAIVDQNHTGDTSGEFTIYAMNFIRVPSAQVLIPNTSVGPGNVTDLGAGTPNLVSSNGGSTLTTPTPDYYQLAFDLNQDSFAGVSVNFDPLNNGSFIDLSTFTDIVFGLSSDKAKTLKLEFEDVNGKKSRHDVVVDVSANYYKFLKNFLNDGVDQTKIKKMNIIVDENSVAPGDEIGEFTFEIQGL